MKDPKPLEWHCSLLGVWLHNGNKIFEGIRFSVPGSQNHSAGIVSQQQVHGDHHLN